jgi:hypothetical protein
MKIILASAALIAFSVPAFAGEGGCNYLHTAKMSVKKPVVAQQLAVVTPETLKLIDGKRVALV